MIHERNIVTDKLDLKLKLLSERHCQRMKEKPPTGKMLAKNTFVKGLLSKYKKNAENSATEIYD